MNAEFMSPVDILIIINANKLKSLNHFSHFPLSTDSPLLMTGCFNNCTKV